MKEEFDRIGIVVMVVVVGGVRHATKIIELIKYIHGNTTQLMFQNTGLRADIFHYIMEGKVGRFIG